MGCCGNIPDLNHCDPKQVERFEAIQKNFNSLLHDLLFFFHLKDLRSHFQPRIKSVSFESNDFETDDGRMMKHEDIMILDLEIRREFNTMVGSVVRENTVSRLVYKVYYLKNSDDIWTFRDSETIGTKVETMIYDWRQQYKETKYTNFDSALDLSEFFQAKKHEDHLKIKLES